MRYGEALGENGPRGSGKAEEGHGCKKGETPRPSPVGRHCALQRRRGGASREKGSNGYARAPRRIFDLGDGRRTDRELVAGESLHPIADLRCACEPHVGLKLAHHVACARVAFGKVARQPPSNDGVELGRNVGGECARSLDGGGQYARQDACLTVGLEQTTTRERLPKKNARREDVGLAADAHIRDLLGRHVGKLALYVALTRDAGGSSRRLGDSEVEHARRTVGSHQYVLGRYVPMHDVEWLALLVGRLVRSVQTAQNVGHDGDGHGGRNALASRARRPKEMSERYGGNVLHHEEEFGLSGDDVERADDFGVLDAGGEASLVEEHRQKLRIAGVLGVQSLDGDGASKARFPVQTRVVHCGRPPRRDDPVELIASRIALEAGMEDGFGLTHEGVMLAGPMPPARDNPATEEVTKAAAPAGDRLTEEGARFRLYVEEGFDAGRELFIHGGEASRLLVGKGPTSDLKLLDPAVSRRHLALEIDRGRLRVTDVGSTNGTRLDDHDIVDAYARGGERLRIGATTLRIERLGVPPAAAPAGAPAPSRFERVLGASAVMQRLYPLCQRLAASRVPVIIEGETGTGKEALAEALHEAGARSRFPFIVFDCTTVAATLVESELFGHERGAFTGALAARKGMFELAEGGTLLIDEIGDLDMAIQPKLLRAVERSEIRRVGSSKPIRCNVRLLLATRRDLEREVQRGRFRDDLFHRLAVARIELPPLRKRRDDIPLLARHFWSDMGGPAGGPPNELLDKWLDMPWPGNVRELRNAVARRIALGELDPTGQGGEAAAAKASGTAGDPAELPDEDVEIGDVLAMNLPFPKARRTVLESFVRRYVARALAASGGNVGAAAAASGIARRYFQLLRDRRESEDE